MIGNPAAILAILAAVVFISLWLEQNYSLFRKLGAAMVGILFGMVLANAGLLPGKSPAYDFLAGPGVSAAVVLILLSVDVRSIRKAGPVMLKAFAIGAVGTAIGSAIMASLLFNGIGPETWKLSGQFTATYTGGGMNFAAVGQALGTSSDLFAAAIAADVLVTALWLIACLAAPILLGGKEDNNTEIVEDRSASEEAEKLSLSQSLYTSGRQIPLLHIAAMVALAMGCVLFADILGSWVPFLPKVLWLTTIVLAIAQIPAMKRLSGSAMFGNYLLLLFLSSNGAQSVVANIIKVGPSVFYFAAGTVALHGIVIFGVGRLLRIDAGTLAVASQANIGGPASAMALASARGYTDRFLPGVAAGLLGYA
ncbi:DUF819 family protein, partial [candidate division KSB1 bacterium]|nr:DUF819 family protein [candidate division KSB1 bacterium]